MGGHDDDDDGWYIMALYDDGLNRRIFRTAGTLDGSKDGWIVGF